MTGMPPADPVHVALRIDAGGSLGVGHAVRCLALGQELRARGVTVTVLGSIAVPWVGELAVQAGIDVRRAPGDPDALAELVGRLGIDAVVIDGYEIDPRTGARLRADGVRVLAMVDEEFGAGQEADVYVDQNLGARPPAPSAAPPGATSLAGLDHVLLRDSVLDRRTATRPEREKPRCLTVFGGTDPARAGEVVVPLLLATGVPLEVIAVTPDPAAAGRLAGLRPGTGQTLDVVGPVPDLPGVAVQTDLTITASGSSVWELLCLGVPTAVVCVADNQRGGYAATGRTGAALPLGELAALRTDPAERDAAVARLRGLLLDAAERGRLAARGRELVDGRGRERVADALLRTLPAAPHRDGGRP